MMNNDNPDFKQFISGAYMKPHLYAYTSLTDQDSAKYLPDSSVGFSKFFLFNYFNNYTIFSELC